MMSSENDGTLPDDMPEHLRQMWKEFFAKNPDATPQEQWIQIVNYLGPTEPTLLLEETNEPSLQRDVSPKYEAYRFYHIGQRVYPSRWIRMERDDDGCRLVAKIREGMSPSGDWQWKVCVDCHFDESEFDRVAQLLNCTEFWNTVFEAQESCSTGATSQCITGRKGNRYHAVHRLMGLPDGLAEAFRLAERLAGFEEGEQ